MNTEQCCGVGAGHFEWSQSQSLYWTKLPVIRTCLRRKHTNFNATATPGPGARAWSRAKADRKRIGSATLIVTQTWWLTWCLECWLDGLECCHGCLECCHDGSECCHDGSECCHDGSDCCHDGSECCHDGLECCHDGLECCPPSCSPTEMMQSRRRYEATIWSEIGSYKGTDKNFSFYNVSFWRVVPCLGRTSSSSVFFLK